MTEPDSYHGHGRALMSQRVSRGEAARVAEAAVRTWDEVSARLVPIIGEHGFNLLYKRSVHLTAATFPWLSAADPPLDGELFADLKLKLERETPARAEAASRELLTTFTGLLNTLIGDGLATRLLASVPRHNGPDGPSQEVS
jgi:hypothetical protein